VNRDPTVYLSHILECIDLIGSYIAGHDLEAFSANQQVQDAILRRLEIIGEAVKNLPQNIRDDNPQVPWRQIAGTRDKVIHDYLGVDEDLIWNVVENLLPELRIQVRTILSAFDSER
jgi:uncharacterized protein with HEPN domain